MPHGDTAGETPLFLAQPRTLTLEQAQRALRAFRISCPALVSRKDVSGLASPGDWAGVCAEAATLDPAFAQGFFFYRFDWVQLGDSLAFATGYFEPEIEGSRTRLPGYVPVHILPPDMVRCTNSKGKPSKGRVDPATGRCLPYFSRAEIEDGALNGRGLELAWAKDPVDLFFVEIQGSGRLRFPDGSVMRIGYDGQNGQEYVAIGRLLRDRGILASGTITMDAIKQWIRTHPEEGKALMRENPSYIFFRELTGAGPIGAMGVAVTPNGSVAADPKFVPLGAPIFMFNMDRPEPEGLWIAQDTGGAIKGPNRFDTFWGAGERAEMLAGSMSASGQALILLPKGVVRRVQTQP